MPIKKAAKKALRQAKKRAVQNTLVHEAYKQAVKAVHKGIDLNQDVTEALRLAQKKLDKASKRGIIKKNTASRKLSRLAAKVHAVGKKK